LLQGKIEMNYKRYVIGVILVLMMIVPNFYTVIPDSYALTDSGLDKILMKLDSWKKAGLITHQENINAIEYYHSRHLVSEQSFKNSMIRVMEYSKTGKYDPNLLKPVYTNIINATIAKCNIYFDGTSAYVLGDVKNRDTYTRIVTVTMQVLDSNNNVLKSNDFGQHQVQGLDDLWEEYTFTGTRNIDHCAISVKILS